MADRRLDKDRVVALIFEAIGELNQTRAGSRQVPCSVSTPLFGSQSVLDSLGLVNLIVGVEARIADETGEAITLADEKAMSQRNSPFRSVDALSDYVLALLNEQGSV